MGGLTVAHQERRRRWPRTSPSIQRQTTSTIAAAAPAPAESGIFSRVHQAVRAHPLALIVIAAVVLRLALAPLTAHLPNGLTDEGFWKHWMEAIDQHGVLNIFRTTETDYVGYHWVLWLLTLVYGAMGGPYNDTDTSLHLLVKVPSIVFDVVLIVVAYQATAVIFQRYGRERVANRAALAAAAVIAFQPAVLYDGPIWAQTDSAITAAMLGSLVLAAIGRPFGSGAVLGLGLAVKPHPIVIAPIVLILLWRWGGARSVLLAGAGLLLVAAVVLGPWILHGDGGRIIDVYRLLFTQDRQRLSELAYNGWLIFDYHGDPRPGTRVLDSVPISFKLLATSLCLVAGVVGVAYAWLRRGLAGALVAGAYLAFAFYMLPIGSHERYLYPFLGLLLPVALLDSRWRWLYVAVSITFLLNLVMVGPPRREWMDQWVYEGIGPAVGATNVALFVAFTLVMMAALARPLFRPSGKPQVAEGTAAT